MPKEDMSQAEGRPKDVDGDAPKDRVKNLLADFKKWLEFISREENYRIMAIFQNVIANSEGRPLKDRVATPAQVQRGEVELEATPIYLSVTLRELKDAGFTVEDELDVLNPERIPLGKVQIDWEKLNELKEKK